MKEKQKKQPKNIAEKKYYIQLNYKNLSFFLAKWFIFPLNTISNKSWAYDDLIVKFPNHIPFVSRRITNSYKKENWTSSNSNKNSINEIFIEIDMEWMKFVKDIEDSIHLYSWILPISKINKIYIQDDEIYNKIKYNLNNISDEFFPEEKITLDKLELKEEDFSKGMSEVNVHWDFPHLTKDYIKKQRFFWWIQMLQLVDKEIADEYKLNIDKPYFRKLKDYLNSIGSDSNINILTSILNKELNEFYIIDTWNEWSIFWKKDFLKNLNTVIKETWQNLEESSEYKEWLRVIFKDLNWYIEDKTPKLFQILEKLDKNKYYSIFILLIIHQYHSIENLKSFIEEWLSKIEDKSIKILLSYIYWEAIWYQSVPKEINNYIFRFDINDSYDRAIYEEGTLKETDLIEKGDDSNKIKYEKEYVYPWSKKVLKKTVIYLNKDSIDGYKKLEDWNKQMSLDLIKKDEKIEKIEKERKNLENRLNESESLLKDLVEDNDNKVKLEKKSKDDFSNAKNFINNKDNSNTSNKWNNLLQIKFDS